VAQSTTKYEFTTIIIVVNQALWLRKVLVDLNMKQERCTKVSVDNEIAISISNNLIFHGKSTHFSIILLFLREMRKEGTFGLIYNKSKLQLANIFTKLLPRSKLEFLRKKIGVYNNKSKMAC